VPVPDPALAARKQRLGLGGDVPSPTNPPPAGRFHTRCPKMQQVCAEQEPLLEPKGPGDLAACHFPLTPEEAAERTGVSPTPA
jgi:oligopeptide/dipeptide ABC transporter ATP-binding protein